MFLIQAGHQSSTQIAEAVPEDGAAGAIWSLADETPDNLNTRMRALSGDGVTQAIDPQLYVIREKLVWVGYSGLTGYLHRAVGASAFAAGFFQKQQWWSLGHWGPPARGRTPRARIVLDSILGSLLIESELATARSQRYDNLLGNDLLTGVGPLAQALREGNNPSTDRGACAAQLFAVCEELDRRVGADLDANLVRLISDIEDAELLYQRIEDAGASLEPRSTSRQLNAWLEAIQLFKKRAEIVT